MHKPVAAGPAGLVSFQHRQGAGHDRYTAVVVLLAGTEHAQAKLRTEVSARKWLGSFTRSAEFEAELPGRLGNASQGGPVAALKASLDQLGRRPFDRAAIRGQAIVAAAVIRVLTSIPNVHTAPSRLQRYSSQLAIVPPNGYYEISKASEGSFRVYYKASDTGR
jgi:hypothetical protein